MSPRSCTPCHAWTGGTLINPTGEGECLSRSRWEWCPRDLGLSQCQEEALESQLASSTARILCRLSTAWGPTQPWPFMTPIWSRSSFGTEIFQQFSSPSVPQPGMIPRKSSVPGAPEGLERRILLMQPWEAAQPGATGEGSPCCGHDLLAQVRRWPEMRGSCRIRLLPGLAGARAA